jgi:formate hydrogenlyase subunit 4
VVGSIAIAFTNSGFGSYPFMIAKILAMYGISETAGNAFGWIVWSSQMFLVVLLGLLSFLFLPLVNRSR